MLVAVLNFRFTVKKLLSFPLSIDISVDSLVALRAVVHLLICDDFLFHLFFFKFDALILYRYVLCVEMAHWV